MINSSSIIRICAPEAIENNFYVNLKDCRAADEFWSSLSLPQPDFSDTTAGVKRFLAQLSFKAGKPLVVLFDEADCLSGQTLISFLRQLRDGYVNRDMAPFPVSVALVGMRNIRDYKAKVRPDSDTLGSASPFNIVAKALTLTNFTRPEIAALYGQHTAETGQRFEEAALDRVLHWSCGPSRVSGARTARSGRSATAA